MEPSGNNMVEASHQWLLPVLHPGRIAIDATCGNGNDTLFLARRTGTRAKVFAFDIQETAITRTRSALAKAGFPSRVSLHQRSHADLTAVIPKTLHQSITAIIFNLGFLPGGDRTITTRAESTIQAMNQAVSILQPGGKLAVVAYPAHPGGGEETKAVDMWFRARNPETCNTITHKPPSQKPTPVFFGLERFAQNQTPRTKGVDWNPHCT